MCSTCELAGSLCEYVKYSELLTVESDSVAGTAVELDESVN